eukprot:6213215-Pleurochrysis_carterae.AAC.2
MFECGAACLANGGQSLGLDIAGGICVCSMVCGGNSRRWAHLATEIRHLDSISVHNSTAARSCFEGMSCRRGYR